jgi:isoaspartyl peptidase/L-asparaginase-like protein (Ntn-hydrolase superfamily)
LFTVEQKPSQKTRLQPTMQAVPQPQKLVGQCSQAGGSAAEAVEAAIRVLEADQTFNAGFGSVLNNQGEVELDAAMMEGGSLAWGALANVQGVRHPISVARKIMDKKPMFLVADHAEHFAAEKWSRDVYKRRLNRG